MSTFSIRFEARKFDTLKDETVLDAMLRMGISTPFSCRGGSCHTCLLQCLSGDIPSKAQRGLGDDLRDKGYFLPCQCVPVGPMQIRPRRPEDMLLRCMLVEVRGPENGTLEILFEVLGTLRYREGQHLRLVTGGEVEPRLVLMEEPAPSVVQARWTLQPQEEIPAWMKDAEFGVEFQVRGPFYAEFDDHPEKPAPASDPALWAELDNGRKARAILESFYTKVYQDPILLPFFQRVTIDRAIGKQYSFMEECFTGHSVYWGEDMRNAHHWMVISHEIFEHRQRLMEDSLREHGLSADQIRRWTRVEEHFRSDIVKDKAWPKRVDGEVVHLEGFESLELSIGTVCDSCAEEVPSGSIVNYHRRTGEISCPKCHAIGS